MKRKKEIMVAQNILKENEKEKEKRLQQEQAEKEKLL
jgi:hypothetical protein